MSTTNPFAAFARTSPAHRGPFADVIAVDETGAPILADGAIPVPCENEMDPATPVAVVDITGGYLTSVSLRAAQRDVDRGLLFRIGAASFQLTHRADTHSGKRIPKVKVPA